MKLIGHITWKEDVRRRLENGENGFRITTKWPENKELFTSHFEKVPNSQDIQVTFLNPDYIKEKFFKQITKGNCLEIVDGQCLGSFHIEEILS